MNDLMLSFSGLEALQNGYHYEGWAIINGSPQTTGKFNIGQNGNVIDMNGNTIPSGIFSVDYDLSAASAIIITIEPNGDTDATPATTKMLGGAVTNGGASLDVSHSAALGNDFSTAAGTYILATPTDGNSDQNENSGIWFLDLSSGSPQAGLNLPQLPDGWQYEGWVVYGGTPITSGTFTAVDEQDDAAPYSGTENGPPFPGEDYLQNAPTGISFPFDLSGGMAVISIEPNPDDSPMPFTLKPLAGTIPGDATDHQNYDMNSNLASFPSGTASIQ